MPKAKNTSFVTLAPETMAKVEALAEYREKLDQVPRNKKGLVTEIINEAHAAAILKNGG